MLGPYFLGIVIAFESMCVAQTPITALHFLSGRKELAVASGSKVSFRAIDTMIESRSMQIGMDQITRFELIDDGSRLLVAGGNPGEFGAIDQVFLHHQGSHELSRIHDDVIYGMDWHPGLDRIVTASWDKTCSVLASDLSVQRGFVGHSSSVLNCQFVPDSTQVVSAGVDRSIQVWDSESGKLVRSFTNHTGSVTDLAVSRERTMPSKCWLASTADDRTLRLWHPDIGRMLRFRRFESKPIAVQWLEPGHRLVVVLDDGSILKVDVEKLDGQIIGSADIGRIFAMELTSQSVIVGGERGLQTFLLDN